MTAKRAPKRTQTPAPADLLTVTEMCRVMHISRATFYRWKDAGMFDGLESPLPNRYSRKRVARFLHGREFEAAS
jgi:predicted DNA-binding transcriptional regulator AlpA